MAIILTDQELINAKRDIDDIGKAVNQKDVVHPRYGDSFKSLPMIVDEFQISSDAAEAAAVSAADSANIAQSSSQIAQDSAAIAELAATTANISGKVYATPADGVDPVTGVADGAYFNVRSSSDESYIDEYQNVGGVPTPSGKSYPSSNAEWDASLIIDGNKTQKEINSKYIDSAKDLFSQVDLGLYTGSRVSTRDNSGAWDVVPSGTGDFDHNGVGLKIPSVFSGGMIPITVFGGVSDYNDTTKTGTPIDTAFNRLMSFCERTGATAQIIGKFYSKGGMKISKPVRLYANAEIYCDNSDNNIALEIGTTGTQFSTNGGSSRLKMEGRLDLRKIRNSAGQPLWWDNTDTTSIGSLEHALHGCSFGGLSVDGFNQNRVWESSGATGYANNNNFDCRCTNGRNNIFALVDGQGYVTENKWFSGLITNANSTPLAAANTVVSISLNTEEGEFLCDNNQFISVNMEDHTSAKIFQTNGQYNIIQNCRLELIKNQSIHFRTGSLNNKLDQCLGIENGKSSPKVLDEGVNNFGGAGTIFQNAFSSYGVFMGSNNTPAENGGISRYGVHAAMHKDNPNRLASALGHKGLGLYKNDVTYGAKPAVWAEAETGRLLFGFGHVEPNTGFVGRSDGYSLTLYSINGTNAVGGLVMGGNYDKGHQVMRTNNQDYHLWVDASGNLRFKKTAVNGNLESNTDGVIVATAT